MYTSTYPQISANPGCGSCNLLERLKLLHPKSIDLSLGRMQRLLGALGHPERSLPPVVHVAGTNGKGSLIAFLRAIAEALGRRVHVYTSPHLVNFHERIVLGGPRGGAAIAEDHLVDCLLRTEAANAGQQVTYFEITTAAAFLAFAETQADLVLLETGMGGRLDATNVVEAPLLTAVTPVSIDHVSYLGNTLTAIASEKAGILKAGVPCVVGRQDQKALDVIQARARAIGAPLHAQGRDFDVVELKDCFVYQSDSSSLVLPMPRLNGKHQIGNAAMAIALANLAFRDIPTTEAVKRGLTCAVWPARFEQLGAGALYDFVGEDTEIWVDGGHNPAGGHVIAQALADLKATSARPVHLVWGMMDSKDARAVISPFKGVVEHVYTVAIPGEPQSFMAQALAKVAEGEGLRASATHGVHHALLMSQAAFKGKGRVLVCGSLHLAGHVLKLHLS